MLTSYVVGRSNILFIDYMFVSNNIISNELELPQFKKAHIHNLIRLRSMKTIKFILI